MAHSAWFQPWLDDMSNDHPLNFLSRLAPVHRRWHGISFALRPVGFLTFHREVIGAFRSSLDSVGSGGLFPMAWDDPSYPYDANLDAIDDLRQFSNAIEGWHNIIHMQFPVAGFADPERNIYMRRFWSLHRLIDDKFGECLDRNNLDDLSEMPTNLHAVV
jgi:hypothetical protein